MEKSTNVTLSKHILKISAAFVLALVFTFVSSDIFAQTRVQPRMGDISKTQFGIKGGLNLSNLTNPPQGITGNRMKLGFHGGIYLKAAATDVFAIQPELLYSSMGSQRDYAGGSSRFNLNYLQLPVMAMFHVTPGFNIHAGPYVSYLINANVVATDNSTGAPPVAGWGANDLNNLNRNNFAQFDYGVGVGVGFDIRPINVFARYNIGLQDVNRTTAENDPAFRTTGGSRNSVIQVGLGFGF
jgi:hypothetical protein